MKFKYLVVHVDEALADRVSPGDIMVDDKRHEADGWTSWTLRNRNKDSTISAVAIGKFVKTTAVNGTPGFVRHLERVAAQVAAFGESDLVDEPDVRAAWEKCVQDTQRAVTEARAELAVTVQ